MDTLLTLLAAAGVTFVMVFWRRRCHAQLSVDLLHDALYVRELLVKRSPEFEAWLQAMAITGRDGRLAELQAGHPLLALAG